MITVVRARISLVMFLVGTLHSIAASSGIESSSENQILTFGFDSIDYDQVAEEMAQDIAGLPLAQEYARKVMTLGPVDDLDTAYHFDRRTFQESLRTRLFRRGLFDFTIALDQIDSESIQDARVNVRYLDWMKDSSTDEELLYAIRDLYSVDFILFGRLSSNISHSGSAREVTHRMNWSIGDCKKGIIIWNKEVTFTKRGNLDPKSPPDWAKYPRLDNNSYYYQVGSTEGASSIEISRNQALLSAKKSLAGRIDPILLNQLQLLDGLAPVAGSEHPVEWKSGNKMWMLFRIPTADISKIREMLALGSKMDAEWESLTTQGSLHTNEENWRTAKNLIANYHKCLMKNATLAELLLEAAKIALANNKSGTAYELLLLAESESSGNAETTGAIHDLKQATPKPERLWILRKAYPKHSVNIIATYKGSSAKVEHFTELEDVLREEFIEAEFPIKQKDRANKAIKFEDKVAGLLNPETPSDQTLAIVISYSKGTGQTEKIKVGGFEIVRPSVDGIVQFTVIDSGKHEIIATGKFNCESHERSTHLAKSLSKQWIESRLLPSFENNLENNNDNILEALDI